MASLTYSMKYYRKISQFFKKYLKIKEKGRNISKLILPGHHHDHDTKQIRTLQEDKTKVNIQFEY